MAIGITIGGVSQTARLRRLQNIDLEYTLGARARMNCQILDTQANTATAYRPALDATAVLVHGATTLINGTLNRVDDAAIVEPKRGVVTTIGVTDGWQAASQRLINGSYPGGMTLKAIVQDIVTSYLSVFGITLDAGMANGPTMGPIVFDLVPGDAAFATLSELSGWVYRLLPTKVLEMFAIGSKTSSFSLTTANIRYARWQKSRTKYVNRQFVRAGSSSQVEKMWTVTGTGAINTWVLEYPGVQYANGGLVVTSLLVTDSALGAQVPIGIVGTAPTAYYNYNPATNAIVRTLGNLPAAATASLTYMAQFPIVVAVEDAAEIAAHGIYEDIADAPEIFDREAATIQAEALLRRGIVVPRSLVIGTRAGLSFPGSVVTVTLPERTVTGNWLITAVRVNDEVDGQLAYEYTLLEGTEAQASWVDFWRQAFGSVTSSGSVSGVGTGAGGGGAIGRSAFFLGGSGIEATQSPTPTWVPASGGGAIGQGAIQVRLNTAARGTTTATVIARMRAADAGVSVQARLYNVTDSVAVAGTSPVVTSTSWTTVAFDVTLTAGAKDYEIQVLPSAAGADVYCTAHVE